MATLVIGEAALITFRCTEDFDSEQFQYSFATGQRDSADWSALIDAMETWWVNELGGLVNKCHLVSIVYSEWDTVGFTGWHVRATKPMSHASNSGNVLPPQCAMVVTLLNTSDTLVPIRNRRGRSYLGLIGSGSIDSNGRLTSTIQTAVHDAMQALFTALLSVTGTSFSGIGVASIAQQVLYETEQFGIGVGVDTQRRRRKKLVESIAYDTWT